MFHCEKLPEIPVIFGKEVADLTDIKVSPILHGLNHIACDIKSSNHRYAAGIIMDNLL
jgi:hypothetical protein